jgi:hypothetical protein
MLKNTLPKKLEKVSIKRHLNYESKYNVRAIYNKHFSLSKQKVRS